MITILKLGTAIVALAAFVSSGAPVLAGDLGDHVQVNPISTTLWTGMEACEVGGDYLYGADRMGLRVFSVLDPLNIAEVSRVRLDIAAATLALSGDRVFIAGEIEQSVLGHQSSLAIVDITDPLTPSLLGTFTYPDLVSDVAVQGDLVFLATRDSGLVVIDASVPTAPIIVSTHAVQGQYQTGRVQAAAVAGDYVCVAGQDMGFQMVDISDPANPVTGWGYGTSWDFSDVCVDGDYAYVAGGQQRGPDFYHGVLIFDISDPANPSGPAFYETGTGNRGRVHSVLAYNNYVYTTRSWSNVDIIDVADPMSPTLFGQFNTEEEALCIATKDTLAFILDQSEINVVDVFTGAGPLRISSFSVPNDLRGVAVQDGYAYVVDGQRLYILNVLDPYSPVRVSEIYIDNCVGGVHVVGSLAFVGTYICGCSDCGSGPDALHVLDVSDPSNPYELSSSFSTGSVDALANGYLYGSWYRCEEMPFVFCSNGLSVFDLTDPSAPSLAAELDTLVTSAPTDVFQVDQAVYLARVDSGLQVIDITDAMNPVEMSNYPLSGEFDYLNVTSGLAFLVQADTFYAFDVNNPADPVLLGRSDSLPSVYENIEIYGKYGYTHDNTLLYIMDLAYPQMPTLIMSHSPIGHPTGLHVVEDLLFISTYNGLEILEIADTSCCGYYSGGTTGNTDCSDDGSRNLADITRLIDYVYLTHQPLCCRTNGDVNGDGKSASLADITRLIDHVYISKAPTALCQ